MLSLLAPKIIGIGFGICGLLYIIYRIIKAFKSEGKIEAYYDTSKKIDNETTELAKGLYNDEPNAGFRVQHPNAKWGP